MSNERSDLAKWFEDFLSHNMDKTVVGSFKIPIQDIDRIKKLFGEEIECDMNNSIDNKLEELKSRTGTDAHAIIDEGESSVTISCLLDGTLVFTRTFTNKHRATQHFCIDSNGAEVTRKVLERVQELKNQNDREPPRIGDYVSGIVLGSGNMNVQGVLMMEDEEHALIIGGGIAYMVNKPVELVNEDELVPSINRVKQATFLRTFVERAQDFQEDQE